MSNFCDRLKEERKRLKLNQEEFAALGGVKKGAQFNYESGSRAPDTDYLFSIAAAGVDLVYLMTGVPAEDAMSDDEKEVLIGYRKLDIRAKARVLGVVEGAVTTEDGRKNAAHITVGGSVGQHITGDIHGTLQGPVMGNKIVKKK